MISCLHCSSIKCSFREYFAGVNNSILLALYGLGKEKMQIAKLIDR